MAYDTELADRLRFLLSGQPVVEKKMFGGLAFLVGGNISVAASGQGGLLVRVDPDESDTYLRERGVEPVDMGRGPMKGWLRVSGPQIEEDAGLREWVDRSVAYARSLPAKKR